MFPVLTLETELAVFEDMASSSGVERHAKLEAVMTVL